LRTNRQSRSIRFRVGGNRAGTTIRSPTTLPRPVPLRSSGAAVVQHQRDRQPRTGLRHTKPPRSARARERFPRAETGGQTKTSSRAFNNDFVDNLVEPSAFVRMPQPCAPAGGWDDADAARWAGSWESLCPRSKQKPERAAFGGLRGVRFWGASRCQTL
jgi:hypothetical protein